MASGYGQFEVVRLLLDSKADANLADKVLKPHKILPAPQSGVRVLPTHVPYGTTLLTPHGNSPLLTQGSPPSPRIHRTKDPLAPLSLASLSSRSFTLAPLAHTRAFWFSPHAFGARTAPSARQRCQMTILQPSSVCRSQLQPLVHFDSS